jgi:hypothetical protein
MKLREYIDKKYNGNVSAFARKMGVAQSQAQRWLSYECIWHDGKVYKRQDKEKFKK